MIYELREYTAVPGRFQALSDRFADVALKLFAEHHMTCVMAGPTRIGPNATNELVYVLQWDSYEQMAAKWSEFLDDPRWKAARVKSESDGPLVERISRRILDTMA